MAVDAPGIVDDGTATIGDVPGGERACTERVEEAMYFLFGQDFRGKQSDHPHRGKLQASRTRTAYNAATRWNRQWRSSTAYTADDEADFDDPPEDGDYEDAYQEEGVDD